MKPAVFCCMQEYDGRMNISPNLPQDPERRVSRPFFMNEDDRQSAGLLEVGYREISARVSALLGERLGQAPGVVSVDLQPVIWGSFAGDITWPAGLEDSVVREAEKRGIASSVLLKDLLGGASQKGAA